MTDLLAYQVRKRSMTRLSMFAGLAGMLIAVKWPTAGLALFAGVMCGLLNALLVMFGSERLVDHPNVPVFVLSSALRIVVFVIVPVWFWSHGPWWTLPPYFIGFFAPLAVYIVLAARDFETG